MHGRRTRSAARGAGGAAAAARRRRSPREAAAAPARVAQEARRSGAAGAPAWSSRCSRSARARGWGVGEIARHPAASPSWAGEAGFSVLQLLPVQRDWRAPMPAPTSPARRSRSIRSTCRSTRARTSRPPAGARRCPTPLREQLDDGVERADASTGARVRAAEAARRSTWRSSASCATSGRSSSAARAAAGRVHRARTATGWTTTRSSRVLARPVRARAGSTGRPARATATPEALAARPPRAARDELLREPWLQWQLDRQWRRARRAGQRGGRRADGRPAVRRRRRLGRRLGEPRALPHRPARWARRPTTSSTATGQDWGLPVYDWEALRARRLRLDATTRASAPASCSACTASTTRSASTGISLPRRRDGEPPGVLAARRERRRSGWARR